MPIHLPVTSESLAAMIVETDAFAFSPTARGKIADTFTDSVAIGIRASAQDVTRVVRGFSSSQYREGPAVVLGTGLGMAPAGAALCNGQAIHSLELDDIGRPSHSHPSCHLVPAILAAASISPVPLNEMVTAFAIGFEIEAMLSVASGGYAHTEDGWHATATFGTMGAAAACARVLGLDHAGAVNALGIAASMVGGLMTAFGTDVKPLHAGLAARSGIEAAMLARDGLRSSPNAVEGEGGFLHVFTGRSQAKAAIAHTDDEANYVDRSSALSMKPFPACGGTHAAIEAGLLAHEQGVDPMQIESIDIAVSTRSQDVLRYATPTTPQQRQFSLQFTTVSALVNGRFDQRSLDEPPTAIVEDLVRRTSWVVDERVEDAVHFGAALEVHLRNGSQVSILVPVPMGREDRWPAPEFLERRFVDFTSYAGVPEADAKTLHRALRGMATSSADSRALLDLLAAVGRTTTNTPTSGGRDE